MTAQQAWPAIQTLALSKLGATRSKEIVLNSIYLSNQFGLPLEELKEVESLANREGTLNCELQVTGLTFSHRAR